MANSETTPWEKVRLGQIARISSGGTPSRNVSEYWNGAIPWITTSKINFGVISEADEFITEHGLKSSAAKVFTKGTLLMAMYGQGATRGRVGILGIDAAINQACASIELEDKTSSEFLFYFLAYNYEQIRKLGHGGNQANLNGELIRSIEILLPPYKEQIGIATILRQWDRAISRTGTLIAAKVKRKRGLMQQLLTGKRRFPKFADRAWEELKLSDVFERVTRKNNEGNTNVVTVSAQRGFVKQNEFFNRLVASENLDGYFLIKEGEFCYNKSYTNNYAWGATKRLKGFEKAVVTTLYICFRVKDEASHSGDFLEQLFEACLLDKGLTKIAHEGGRAHGLLNVTPSDFFNLVITIPSYDEQVAIAQILQTADREIDLLKKQLDALKRQKRGLMQKLLTGQIRVKVDDFEAAAVEAS
ncbi:MAG TPA: restriction endonuclease subunit S [Pyrinomonadaceae bacterium]|nr:restriction endonuclease subunit S [Pyrinomonadaceae bacterium]